MQHGTVVASPPIAAGGTRADGVLGLDVGASARFLLRAWSARGRDPARDLQPLATTSPVQVTMSGARCDIADRMNHS